MPQPRDQFHHQGQGSLLFSNFEVTAAGKLGLVIDRRDLPNPAGDAVGIYLLAHAVATADPTDFIKIVMWEADEKTDASTLDGGAIVDVGTGSHGEGSGTDSDVIGYTVDGARQRIDNPAYDTSLTVTARTETEFLQDGVFPLIDDTALANSLFYFQYRGHRDVLQLFAEKGPGGVSGFFSAFYVLTSGKTRNEVNPGRFD